ncbi:hypothetical protein BDR22DRAFT_877088 [Usnea florida]
MGIRICLRGAVAREIGLGYQRSWPSGIPLLQQLGPAETTVASSKIEVPSNDSLPGDLAPAGFMLPNYLVCILDARLNPVTEVDFEKMAPWYVKVESMVILK